ncbi:MAG TPA: hypothetical protein VIS74_06540 [Chthoniobacterales bacterium]
MPEPASAQKLIPLDIRSVDALLDAGARQLCKARAEVQLRSA